MKTITIEKDAEIVSIGDDTFEVSLSERPWERFSVPAFHTTLTNLEDDDKIGKVKVRIEIEIEGD